MHIIYIPYFSSIFFVFFVDLQRKKHPQSEVMENESVRELLGVFPVQPGPLAASFGGKPMDHQVSEVCQPIMALVNPT